jgi:Kinesin motor domain
MYSWDELRKVFTAANARKAIAPTQFNHQSTRGHCIMTLELELPHPSDSGMKQKSRLYVCDLAGTEPAGDIVHAQYDRKVYNKHYYYTMFYTILVLYILYLVLSVICVCTSTTVRQIAATCEICCAHMISYAATLIVMSPLICLH